MRKRTEDRKIIKILTCASFCLVMLLFVYPCPARSQDQPQGNPTDPQQPESVPDHPVTSTLDTGESIDTDNKVISALRVGHWSLLDFSLFYAYDNNYAFQPTNPSASNAAAASALILYSRQNSDSGIDFQYQPYLFASAEPGYRSLFLDQLLDLHIYRHLSARWIINVDERFRYEPDNGSLFDPTIIPNYTTGQIFQTPFLANGQSSIQNGLVVSLIYTLTDRDTVTFHAQYEYDSLTNQLGVPNPFPNQGFQTSDTIGGGVSWNHRWHLNQQIGVNYTYARQILTQPSQQQEYNTLLVTYEQKIRPTLTLQLAVGPSIQSHSNGTPASKTVVGHADLLKTFRSAFLTLSFARDYGFTGVISNSYHDRYDASYSQYVGRRLVLSAGIGYIKQDSLVVAELNGRDIYGRVDYELNNRWGIFGQLTVSAVAGPGLPYADRDLFTGGVRWSSKSRHEFQQ